MNDNRIYGCPDRCIGGDSTGHHPACPSHPGFKCTHCEGDLGDCVCLTDENMEALQAEIKRLNLQVGTLHVELARLKTLMRAYDNLREGEV
jgi:hypothetical protein